MDWIMAGLPVEARDRSGFLASDGTAGVPARVDPDSVSQTTAIKRCSALPRQVSRLDSFRRLTVAGQHRIFTGFPSAGVVAP